MTSALRVTESEWLTAVADALDYTGWWWYHTRPARRTNGKWVTATLVGMSDPRTGISLGR